MIDEEFFVVVLKKESEDTYTILTVFPTENPPDTVIINIYALEVLSNTMQGLRSFWGFQLSKHFVLTISRPLVTLRNIWLIHVE